MVIGRKYITNAVFNLGTGRRGVRYSGEPIFNKLRIDLGEAGKRTNNLRPVFKEISVDFFATNKKLIFSQSGTGGFRDLERRTKQDKYPNIYPILVRSGRLMKSLTLKRHMYSVRKILNRSMSIGTSDPTAKYHQYGFHVKGTRITPRPSVQIGRERLNRWMKMVADWQLRTKGAI